MTHALPLRRIVVGVDGSAASAAAVRWAVREARLRRATVHLVCAYHGDARLRAPYASSSWTARLHQRHAAGRVALDLATEAASRRLPPDRLIAELADEPPARALLDRAADAVMLVLGSTRPEQQPGQPPLAMGPVARACLRLAHCPVVVVAPDQPWDDQGAGRRRGSLGTQRRATPGPAPPHARAARVGTPGLRGFLVRFRLTILRPGRRQPRLAGFPAVRSPSRSPTSTTVAASQTSRSATGISSRFCGACVPRSAPRRGCGRCRHAGRGDRQQVIGQLADAGRDVGVKERAQPVTAADDAR